MTSESLAEKLYAKTISLTYSAPDRSLTPQQCHEALAAEALAWLAERMPTREEIAKELHTKVGVKKWDQIGIAQGIYLHMADAILTLLSARTRKG